MIHSTSINPPSPISGIHEGSLNQIVWNWSPVIGATGYRWNSVNDYATATDMGTTTTKTETGLDAGTTYTRFVWAYNNCGASEATILTQLLPYFIGQNHGGGIIFYIDGTSQHGLIAAGIDQSTGTSWGCYGTSIPGTSYEIGTGQANTMVIINACNTAGIAARLCDELLLNGFSDWFLPSKDELNQMWLQHSFLGLSESYFYWSSSQSVYNPTEYAWLQTHSGVTYGIKSLNYYVRAIRAF